jgi:Erv1 / Alr family
LTDVNAYGAFFIALPNVLPCKLCRENFAQHLQTLPPKAALLQGRKALFRWSVKLHNMTNMQHGSPMLTLEAAREMYEPERCNNAAHKTLPLEAHAASRSSMQTPCLPNVDAVREQRLVIRRALI